MDLSMEESNNKSKQVENINANINANVATTNATTLPPPTSSSTASSSVASSLFSSGSSSLLQPSSFSSSLSNHPFLARSPVKATVSSSSSSSSSHVPAFTSSTVLTSPERFGGGTAGSYTSLPTSTKTRAKRTSEQFDNTHSRDAEAVDSRQSKLTRGDSDDDDDDDNAAAGFSSQELMDEEEQKRAPASNNKKDERVVFVATDEDSSFMNLLSKLAKLEFPDTLEACPVCSLKFPLDQFADHVYQCITKLDAEEKRDQELMDARLATEIAFRDVEEQQKRMAHRFIPPLKNTVIKGTRRLGGGGGGDMSDGEREEEGEEDEDDSRAKGDNEASMEDTEGGSGLRGGVPRRAMLRGGHALAFGSSGRPAPSAPSDPEALERELLARYAQTSQEACKAGRECTRTDAQHFISKYHPEVTCPICNEQYPVFEINPHITFCLESPKPVVPTPPKDSANSNADRDMMDDNQSSSKAAASSTSSSNSLFNSTPVSIPLQAGMGATSAAAAGAARRPRRLGPRSSSANMISRSGSAANSQDILSPPLGLYEDDAVAADDELDDDDDDDAARIGSLTRGESNDESKSAQPVGSAGAMHRSNSDCSLSLAQAAAVASMVIKRRGEAKKDASSTGSSSTEGKNDPSLLDLLTTFSTLGFTREKLQELHDQHEKQTQEKEKEKAQEKL